MGRERGVCQGDQAELSLFSLLSMSAAPRLLAASPDLVALQRVSQCTQSTAPLPTPPSPQVTARRR